MLLQLEVFKKLGSYDHVIWDYNGTLIDDVAITCEVINIELERFALSSITLEEYRCKFGFPIRDYYLRLGLNLSQFDEINRGFYSSYRKNFHRAKLFRHTTEILQGLKKQGCRLSVLSAAHQTFLEEGLKHFGIFSFFDEVLGVQNHSAEGKDLRGRQLVEKYPKLSTVMVGDTDYDYQVAQKIGAQSVLVAEGHQTWERLQGLHGSVFESWQ